MSLPAELTPRETAMVEVLMSAALCIASFRWKLRQAGFPFAEPHNVNGIIAEIDSLVYPDDPKRKRNSGAARIGAN